MWGEEEERGDDRKDPLKQFHAKEKPKKIYLQKDGCERGNGVWGGEGGEEERGERRWEKEKTSKPISSFSPICIHPPKPLRCPRIPSIPMPKKQISCLFFSCKRMIANEENRVWGTEGEGKGGTDSKTDRKDSRNNLHLPPPPTPQRSISILQIN